MITFEFQITLVVVFAEKRFSLTDERSSVSLIKNFTNFKLRLLSFLQTSGITILAFQLFPNHSKPHPLIHLQSGDHYTILQTFQRLILTMQMYQFPGICKVKQPAREVLWSYLPEVFVGFGALVGTLDRTLISLLRTSNKYCDHRRRLFLSRVCNFQVSWSPVFVFVSPSRFLVALKSNSATVDPHSPEGHSYYFSSRSALNLFWIVDAVSLGNNLITVTSVSRAVDASCHEICNK